MDVTTLKTPELKQLIADAQAELVLRSDTNNISDLWYEAIAFDLSTRGITVPPLSLMKKRQCWSSFRDQSERVEPYIANFLKGTTKHHRQLSQAARKICVRTLVDSLRKWATVDHVIVMRKLETVPAALNESFPGYGGCGMWPVVLRATVGDLPK
jgi:hypothetical protein